MTYKPVLPQPPEFPASNASYNKIVDKMHKAALNAATSTAAVAAVQMCVAMVKGTNTYAKASRRYGSQLLDALAAADVPAGLEAKMNAEPVGSPKKGALAAPSDKAFIAAIVAAADGKVYSNKSNAKRGLKSLGLDHLPVTFLKVGDGDEVQPVVTVDDDKGLAYAKERGIRAKVSA